MVHKLRLQAEEVGLTDLRLTVLYARPNVLKKSFMVTLSTVGNVIGDYITFMDPSCLQGRSGGPRNNTFYCLAPHTKIYVEVQSKVAGYVGNPKNHVSEIRIYCEIDRYIRGIAYEVNRQFPNGLLANMNWKALMKKFVVGRGSCLAEWVKWLAVPNRRRPALEQITPEPEEIAPEPEQICQYCGA